ncbi:unnamed protein product, partial [Ectocarpus sp. 8 AP-2014]
VDGCKLTSHSHFSVGILCSTRHVCPSEALSVSQPHNERAMDQTTGVVLKSSRTLVLLQMNHIKHHLPRCRLFVSTFLRCCELLEKARYWPQTCSTGPFYGKVGFGPYG